jgi:uncharacterized membrane protein
MNDTRFQFPVWPLIRDGWGFFLAAFVPLFFGHIVIQIIYQVAGPLAIIVTGPLWYGLCVVSQDAARGNPTRFEDIFAGFRLFLPTFLVGLYLTLFMIAAVLIILIPGIIACYIAYQTQSVPVMSLTFSISLTACLLPLCFIVIYYSPVFFIMRDEGLGAWDAMEASRKMVKANLGAWISLWVGISILHIAGILTCCIGLLFVMPWMTVILAMAYDMQRGATAFGRPDYKGEELP